MSNPVNAYLRDKYEWGLLCECPIDANLIEKGQATVLSPCGHIYGLPMALQFFGECIGNFFAEQGTTKKDVCALCQTNVVTYIPSPGADDLIHRGNQYVVRNDAIVEEIERIKQSLRSDVFASRQRDTVSKRSILGV
jgi:hypothetical protein